MMCPALLNVKSEVAKKDWTVFELELSVTDANYLVLKKALDELNL